VPDVGDLEAALHLAGEGEARDLEGDPKPRLAWAGHVERHEGADLVDDRHLATDAGDRAHQEADEMEIGADACRHMYNGDDFGVLARSQGRGVGRKGDPTEPLSIGAGAHAHVAVVAEHDPALGNVDGHRSVAMVTGSSHLSGVAP